MTNERIPESGIQDYSILAILASNVLTIVLAFTQGWELMELLWVYWCQSVIIGFSNFMRMMKLRNFSTEGFSSNGDPVPETPEGKRSTAYFFAFHYGFFHVVYLVFLIPMGEGLNALVDPSVLAGILAFLASHVFSFRYNIQEDLKGRPNIGTMMFLPYARVVPMHLTIIFGIGFSSSPQALLLFLILKTIADVVMHVVEHRVLRGKR